jgi:hypothetical protein
MLRRGSRIAFFGVNERFAGGRSMNWLKVTMDSPDICDCCQNQEIFGFFDLIKLEYYCSFCFVDWMRKRGYFPDRRAQE